MTRIHDPDNKVTIWHDDTRRSLYIEVEAPPGTPVSFVMPQVREALLRYLPIHLQGEWRHLNLIRIEPTAPKPKALRAKRARQK